MAEPFKNQISPPSVARLAAAIREAFPAFSADSFAADATAGLLEMELKARVAHVARCLRPHLPTHWAEAVDIVIRSLPPSFPTDDLGRGMPLWPLLQLVEDFGLDEPETSLAAMPILTSRWSAEFAVRPYIERYPDLAWSHIDRWADSADPHVRRLASEGPRPRLPWGRRLTAAIADPSRGLAVLDRLVDDPSAYVRRSVGNHLGDVAKDHPLLAVAAGRRWMEARPSRRPLVERGLRDLLKKGHPGAITLFGAPASAEVMTVASTPAIAAVGGSVRLDAELAVRRGGDLRIDVVWRWPGARTGFAAKTFRGVTRRVEEGERVAFVHRLALRPVSTRVLRPGRHELVLRVNGVDAAPASFELRG